MVLKWGIVGTGYIAGNFVSAVKISPDEHEVLAVASRTKEKSEEFAAKCDIPRAYGSYLELAADNEVEVVYIGVINTEHYALSKMMLKYGKHVLCEKPLGINSNEVCKLIKLARKKNVFLMEGIWSRFNPVYEKLRQELAAGTIGEVRLVVAHFGYKAKAERVKKKKFGGGGLLDIGVYCLQLATLIFGNEEPQSMQVSGILNEDGVDESASINLKFKEREIAALSYSICYEHENTAHIYGTNGSIKIGAPLQAPTEILVNDSLSKIELPKSQYSFTSEKYAGFKFEADHVKTCIDDGLLESPLNSLSESLLWVNIMDRIRKKLGVHYDQDQ